jgi:plastocyanin
MRKMVSILVILLFVLAVGCASKPAEQAPAPAPVQAPPLKQVEQAEPAAVPTSTPAVAPEEPKAETPIGSRVTGTEQIAVEEEVPEEVQEIKLNPEKTMSETVMTVAKGTTLFWKNYDTWPHQLKVTSGKGLDTQLHGESSRLLPGNVWNFTFNEKGVFVVRDIYSGGMRMNVTVE